MNWRPNATPELYRQRALMLMEIRSFFMERDVLEVETPLLGSFGVTDPYIDNLQVALQNQQTGYLQTSPEYAMKRLLASGCGSIYQICKSFRGQETGSLHNPEFTLLEWYRVGFDHHDLMREVGDLLEQITTIKQRNSVSYSDLFMDIVGLDPINSSLLGLGEAALSAGLSQPVVEEAERDLLLEFLFSQTIQPHLGAETICFVHSYPESQAALARLSDDAQPVAQRFEVFINGIELANGYHELTDARQQLDRFERDNKKRESMNKPVSAIDQRLLGALESGLPDCAGVALGLDRLLMIISEADDIQQTLTFPFDRA